MRLIRRIMNRMAVALVAALTAWVLLFYWALGKEIVRETDGALARRSEQLMRQYLAERHDGSAASAPSAAEGGEGVRLVPVTEEYAAAQPARRFSDGRIRSGEGLAAQPARTLRTIFRDGEGRPLMLSVSTPTVDAQRLRRAVLFWVAALYVVLLTLVLCVNYWVIQRSMEPLYALLRWMDAFDLHAHADPIDNPTEVSEFRQLNEAANRQVTRARERYEEQRRFVDNAAHELQTPLAVALNRLEQMQQDDALGERTLNGLQKVKEPLQRLVRLQRDMLRLSRIDNGAYREAEPVALRPLAERLNADFAEMFAHKRIVCRTEGEGDPRPAMHPALAELLVGNLLRNAWIHTPPEGRIEVVWEADALTVANTGGEALDAARLFERFHHTPARRDSNGLGLAICRSVCRQYGFGITYRFAEGCHRFRVEGLGEKN